MTGPKIDRRRFLRGSGMVMAGGAVAPLLAACGGSSSDGDDSTPAGGAGSPSGPQGSSGEGAASSAASGTTAGGTAARGGSALPTYVPASIVKPDLPLVQGVPPAFFTYPANPPQQTTKPPASGGTISMLKFGNATIPGVGSNPFWKEMNKRVGADMKLNNLVGGKPLQLKEATVLAGGDLPDLMQINPQASIPSHIGEALKAKFVDLTEYLSGDNVKKYPNLAAIPTAAWLVSIFDGHIYGVPDPVPVVGNDEHVRLDITDKLGLSTKLSNGQDFLALCQGLTDPKANRWAFGHLGSAEIMTQQMVGAPNGWKVEDGKFISAFETDEYKQSIGIVRQMWKDGYFEPDAPAASTSQWTTWFVGGRTPLAHASFNYWKGWHKQGQATKSGLRLGELILPKWSGGGQAGHFETGGGFTMVSLKKASEERVDELLRVINWFAAPFGTEEYLFTRYGIEGRDYTLDGSDPVETKTGTTECVNMRTDFIGNSGQVLYYPGDKDFVTRWYQGLVDVMKVPVPIATAGLRSETAQAKSGVIGKTLADLRTGIETGRKPLSAWEDGVKSWLKSGGEQIRKEYEEAYAKAPK